MKSQSYMTRAMRARDPRFATILGKLGYDRADAAAASAKDAQKSPAQVEAPAKASEPLAALRKQYQEFVGKRPFHGWGPDELTAKIAEAKASK